MHPICDKTFIWMAAEFVGRIAEKEKKKMESG